MKQKLCTVLLSLFALFCISASAQKADTVSGSGWHHLIEANFYFMKDEFMFLPIYSVDKNWLHLEARYNYEERNTFSAWFGYNFSGGKKFQYTITPMLGALAGSIYGMAPGIEMDFRFYRFEFSSQSEYVLDFNDRMNYFFYNWTDITYSPLDWLWFGFSYQRNRLYQTSLDFQYGLIAGGGYRWFGLTAYVYNIGTADLFGVLTIAVNLPER
jgi:hypothetical protein